MIDAVRKFSAVVTNAPQVRCSAPLLKLEAHCSIVCGEDCTIQVCPKCASEEQKDQIADFVMQRTLAEVDPDFESLEELVITIPSCHHTFTVETLDGHCSMSEFYSTGPNGEWRGLMTPIGFRRPPTCPTCRSDITAPCYGRVFKRAALDILERNVAAQMSLSLGTVQKSLESVPANSKKDQLVNVAATIDLKFKDKTEGKTRAAQEKARRKALNSQNKMPISERDINPASKQLHCIDGLVLDAWRKSMHELLTAYKQAVHVAETRSAHPEAWESAFSCLHEREVDVAICMDTFYQPISLEERITIVKALNFCKSRLSFCVHYRLIENESMMQHIQDISTTVQMGTHLLLPRWDPLFTIDVECTHLDAVRRGDASREMSRVRRGHWRVWPSQKSLLQRSPRFRKWTVDCHHSICVQDPMIWTLSMNGFECGGSSAKDKLCRLALPPPTDSEGDRGAYRVNFDRIGIECHHQSPTCALARQSLLQEGCSVGRRSLGSRGICPLLRCKFCVLTMVFSRPSYLLSSARSPLQAFLPESLL